MRRVQWQGSFYVKWFLFVTTWQCGTMRRGHVVKKYLKHDIQMTCFR